MLFFSWSQENRIVNGHIHAKHTYIKYIQEKIALESRRESPLGSSDLLQRAVAGRQAVPEQSCPLSLPCLQT